MAARAKTKTIDAYLATLPTDQRVALKRLRTIIRAAAPKAEECISYQIPSFRQDGMLVGFGATANHCTFFVMSSSILKGFTKELKGYETGKGSIQFQPAKPLPVALVRKLVKARMAENARRRGRAQAGRVR